MANLVAFSLLFFFSLHSGLAAATEFLVGGSADAWTSSPQLLNRWAEANRFQFGDSLVWKNGSVLEVTREAYVSCNRSNPLAEHAGGATVRLARSGPHYFISGEEGGCEKGVKLIVVVMSDRWRRAAVPSAGPAPSSVEAPAAMTGGAAFSTAPFSSSLLLVFLAGFFLLL